MTIYFILRAWQKCRTTVTPNKISTSYLVYLYTSSTMTSLHGWLCHGNSSLTHHPATFIYYSKLMFLDPLVWDSIGLPKGRQLDADGRREEGRLVNVTLVQQKRDDGRGEQALVSVWEKKTVKWPSQRKQASCNQLCGLFLVYYNLSWSEGLYDSNVLCVREIERVKGFS